jgi:ElaA protein
MNELNWQYKSFNELSIHELYAILKARAKVFIVEQTCPYLDTDGKDQEAFHLFALKGEEIAAYARILPPGLAFKECSIGRVMTDPGERRSGAGRELMEKAIHKAFNEYNTTEIRIGAQLYLERFYTSLGFKKEGEVYLEDEIPHIEMMLSKK